MAKRRNDESVPSASHISDLARRPSGFANLKLRADFIQYDRSKSAVFFSTRESIFPLALVTVLFVLWGGAYGLLDVLNKKLQAMNQYSAGRSTGLHSAYFAGYFFAPLLWGNLLLRKCGFRITFIAGLIIYGCGTTAFWPSACLKSYTGYVISNFLVGCGVGSIENAANLFVILTGKKKHWEARLNISQGFQAIGTVCAPILADRVMFKNVHTDKQLIDVQWTYLGIAFFDFALALVFWYAPYPEAANEDIDSVNMWPIKPNLPERKQSARIIPIAAGVVAQWFYVGIQEVIAVYGKDFVDKVKRYNPNRDPAVNHYLWSAEALFAISRLGCGFAMVYIKPRLLYPIFALGTIITSALLLGFPYTVENAGRLIALRLLVQFFEGPLFPTIFAISLRGATGSEVKHGASWMVIGTSGGAVWPPVYGAIVSRYQGTARGYQVGWGLCLAGFIAGAGVHSFLLNFVKSWRVMLDELWTLPSPTALESGRKKTKGGSDSSGMDASDDQPRNSRIGELADVGGLAQGNDQIQPA